MAIMHTVQEQTAPGDTTHSASSAPNPDPAPAPDDTTSAPHRDTRREPPTAAANARDRDRRPLFGSTAAVTIIASLIAAMTLAAVTAFNTLRSDILSVRTELRGEIASVRTELHEFRTEVSSVLLDHTDRLARLEALILHAPASPSPSQQP